MSDASTQGRTEASGLADPPAIDVAKRGWAGPDAQAGAAKPTLAGFISAPQRDDRPDRIDVHVVCNEPEMRPELQAAYETDSYQPMEITYDHGVTVAELRSIISSDVDFLHYVGHVDATGLRCRDGFLDACTILDSGVTAFLLNGCASSDQGVALQRAGSVFGIVTTDVVENQTAIDAGRAIAQLLDHGFTPLDAIGVVSVAFDADQFAVIGDATHRISASENGSVLPTIRACDVRDDAVIVTLRLLPNADWSHGAINNNRFAPSTGFLYGDHDLVVRRRSLREVIGESNAPVLVDDDLYWLDDFTPDEFWTLLQTRRRHRQPSTSSSG